MELTWLQRWQPQLLAILRIVTGLLFVEHATVKFFSFPTAFQVPPPLPPILVAAGIIELVAGTLITVGLFTRLAAFIASGEIAIGYWMMHGSKSFWPIVNQGEAAIMFCFIFLYIAAAGPGAWSIDRARYPLGDDGTRNRAR
jgi:putative oxidoreductase